MSFGAQYVFAGYAIKGGAGGPEIGRGSLDEGWLRTTSPFRETPRARDDSHGR